MSCDVGTTGYHWLLTLSDNLGAGVGITVRGRPRRRHTFVDDDGEAEQPAAAGIHS